MMASILSFATENQVAALVALALLVVLVVLVMALVLVRGGKEHKAEEVHDEKADLELVALPSPEHVEEEKKKAAVAQTKGLRGLLKAGIAGYRESYARDLYLMPWVLRMGGGTEAGLLSSLEEVHPQIGTTETDGLAWHFYMHGLVVDVATAQAFNETLRFAARRRPAMPMDGVILTIPVQSLSEPRAAAAMGTQLYEQLWSVQRTLGYAVPVYVVVTGVEVLPGFSTFEGVLPPALRNGMIGWSSPYALETAFSPEYVSEALHGVDQAMLSATMEVFGTVVDAPEGTRLVRVREDLHAMDEQLRTVLGIAFRRTAYQESLFFRGLYFTLQPEPGAAASFAHDLMEHKIFAERALSRPLRNATTQSGRIKRWMWPAAAGGTALVGALSILLSLANLSGYREVVEPALKTTATDMAAVASRPESSPATITADNDATLRFLRNVTQIDESEPFVLMPLTWFGADPYGVRAAMRAGWRGIALRTVKLDVEQKLQALKSAGDGGVGATDSLTRFLNEVIRADGAVNVFNETLHGGKNEPTGALLQYALGVPTPAPTLRRLEAWDVVGADSEAVTDPTLPIDPANVQDADVATFRDLADAYFRTMALGGEATARLTLVARELQQLSRGAARGNAAVAGFTEVAAGLQEANRSLSGGGQNWIGASRPIIPAEMDRLINAGAASPLLGDRARRAADQVAQTRYNEVKGQIVSFDSVIGPLVRRTQDGAALSTQADGLRALLTSWLATAFMHPPANTRTQAQNTGYGWDQTALEAVPPLFEDYVLFLSKTIPQVPASLRAVVNQTAQFELQANITQALNQASAPVDVNAVALTASMADLKAWSASLRTAFPVLEQTIQTYNQIGMTGPAEALRDRVSTMGSAIVQRVDRILDTDQLYLYDRTYLANWRGGPLDPAGLFGQSGPQGLAQYMTSARLEITSLARDIASPMLEVLARPVMATTNAYVLAEKWLAIVAALDQYDASRPNNSLMTLEKYINEGVAATNETNCLTALPPASPLTDFFAQRLIQLRDALHARCLSVYDESLVAGYQALQGQFNSRLANHAPFAAPGVPNQGPALAADVHEFYATMDQLPDVVKRLAAIGEQRADWREPARFVAQMTAARPLLDLITNPAPGTSLSVMPEFRTNRDREAGGANVLEWTMASGERTISSFTPHANIPWGLGNKVSLSLRWAKDGPVVPAQTPDIAGGAPTIDGLAATFTREGPWALIDFLRAYRLSTPGARTELQFQVNTLPRTGAPGAPAKPAQAKLFAGIALQKTTVTNGQRKDEPLVLTQLPAAAPTAPGQGGGPLPLLSSLRQPQVSKSMPNAAIDNAVFGIPQRPAPTMPVLSATVPQALQDPVSSMALPTPSIDLPNPSVPSVPSIPSVPSVPSVTIPTPSASLPTSLGQGGFNAR